MDLPKPEFGAPSSATQSVIKKDTALKTNQVFISLYIVACFCIGKNKRKYGTIKVSITNLQFQVGTVVLYGIPIVSLVIESQERLCLAQISNTLLKQFSYNEIHNRRVALGKVNICCN